MKKILVIGSYNVGLSVIGDKIPSLGETIMGSRFDMGPGGKGSNQALALARLGADLKFMCCIGDDTFGKDALALFKKENLATDAVKVIDDCHTGVGLILIDNKGHNAIGVVAGANSHLTIADLHANKQLFEEADFLLIQLENNLDVVEEAIRIGHSTNTTVVFNPAPAQAIKPEILALVDYITPNETEASIISGIAVTDLESAYAAADALISKGSKNVIITLAECGSILLSQDKKQHFPAKKVKSIDSTGAGDAFNGGLVYALSTNQPIEDAIDFASKVAALAVTKIGTVAGLPTLTEVNNFNS
ncbi:ribokinase [Pedobacter petrophilus]|uniref:Ribokinase n=2 Tax=Pedobacter TaxID=84567 RepID=A0A7K0G0W4_9SPHI|nr:ribokinase [Pedobacter petrophilus]MRX76974.1 ribokinase [Pedobacter petrophilus]